MKKIKDKITQLETQIIKERVNEEKELLITEMKKIGIEKLPYSYAALKNFIDAETMDFHYNKHYKGYVDKLNDALSKKKYGDLELEKIIKTISRFDKDIRNNAGGAFNHSLFWNMLTPNPKKLTGDLYKKITKQWGTFSNFKKEFEKQAKSRFGSGWVWLVVTSKNTLKIMTTPNQDNPLMNIIQGSGFPILGLDLWEHAYYLKYKNKRDEYITNFWKVVNWDFVSKMYDMKVETKLLESIKMKQMLVESKTEMCSQSENEFYRMLFNINPDVKRIYMNGINEILKDVFSEKYISTPDNNQLSGIYNLEGPGRSVINKLNTNYTSFCILLKDLNKVISKTTDKEPISFKGKTPKEQNIEAERFVRAIKHFKERIFDKDSTTFHNLLKILIEKDKLGAKREQITAAIIRRYFGKDVIVELFGELGSKKDALQGVDLELTKEDGKKYTAQVKPFRHMFINEDGIVLEGTASVKIYNTDLMIFQKGKNVLIFNKKPKIVNGNFVFPTDSLMYNIQ
jgi:Fe-Mn family superoxide dismutase